MKRNKIMNEIMEEINSVHLVHPINSPVDAVMIGWESAIKFARKELKEKLRDKNPMSLNFKDIDDALDALSFTGD